MTTYSINPSILSKANVVADAEEETGIPVNKDQDEHHNL